MVTMNGRVSPSMHRHHDEKVRAGLFFVYGCDFSGRVGLGSKTRCLSSFFFTAEDGTESCPKNGKNVAEDGAEMFVRVLPRGWPSLRRGSLDEDGAERSIRSDTNTDTLSPL